MEIKGLPTPKEFSFDSYRNIATIQPGQTLYDDIVDPDEYQLIFDLENETSGIDHSERKTNRVFQYCQNSMACFNDLNGIGSRFSKNYKFGVWYGALEEQTSIFEIIYHRKIEIEEQLQNPSNTDSEVVVDRSLFKANIKAKNLVDLKEYPSQQLLIDNNYDFCQKLGEYAVSKGIDAYFTPSARNPGGICTPIFTPDIINDQFLKYIKIKINRESEVYLNEDSTPLKLPW